jgi:hypothetical protein
MDKSKLPIVPCGLIACEHHNGYYPYNCDKSYQEILDCSLIVADEKYINKTTTSTETIKKPSLKQIVDIRNIAKYITIKIVIKTKGKFLFNIGLNIMKFGAWITGCNIQVITNTEDSNISLEKYKRNIDSEIDDILKED